MTTVSSNPALDPSAPLWGCKASQSTGCFWAGPHGGQGGDICAIGYVLPSPQLQPLGLPVQEAGGFGAGWDPCLSRSPRMFPAPELRVRW